MGLKINGSTSGSIEIDVPAVAGTNTAITIPATTGGEFIVSDASGNIDLGALDISGSASADSVVIDSSGRIGIGTTSPGQRLDVAGDARLIATGDTARQIILDANRSAAAATIANINFAWNGTNVAQIRGIAGSDTANKDDAHLEFFTAAAGSLQPRMRIDSSGRLLVGTSSTSARANTIFQGTSGGVDVAEVLLARNEATPPDGNTLGDIQFSDNTHTDSASIKAQRDGGTWSASSKPTRLVFSTAANSASSPTERMRINSAGEVETTAYTTSLVNHITFNNPNGEVGKINTSGTTTFYNTSSDYRLKENIVSLTGALDRIKNLQVKRFNFIADPTVVVDGFIAHEAQAVVPECVTGEKDAVDDEGNPQYQGIDQSKLVPLLTAALQEAIAKIETLETANASLEARLTALEGGAS